MAPVWLLVFPLSFVMSGGALAPVTSFQEKQDQLRLEDLFPEESFFGKSARSRSWSHDDRYLGYLWNPYEDRGFDLWIYDTKERKARRLTSLEMMTNFDREATKILERYRREKEEREKLKGLSEEERRKREEELRRQRREESAQEYAGISEYTWAHTKHEVLFVYRGDIFRLKVGDELPVRLTKTQDAESGVSYTRDDGGMIFRRGSNVFRMRFDSAQIEQLNPPLPHNTTMGRYWLSPDETKILISSSRQTGQSRQVTYITYRGRLAEARTTERSMADDTFKAENYLFLYDLHDDPKKNPEHDGKPWEIYRHAGGEEYEITSVHDEPFSQDSKRLVFAKWNRNKRSLEIMLVDIAKKEVRTIFRDTHDGEHTTPSLCRPFFTPDGSKVLCLLERSGYRHVWVVDPLKEGATQLTRGDFEVYPEKLSADGRHLLVTSSREHPARVNLYLVQMEDGSMERITQQNGSYSNPEPNHSFTAVAVSFASWTHPTETYLLSLKNRQGEEVALTKSHSETFYKVNKLTPALFDYQNRHGHTVYGFMFLPPNWKPEEKRPLMIYVYGGPLGTGRSVIDGSFNSEAYWFHLYLAYNYGYICITVDPRGQSGYGAVFGKANWEQPGKPQVEDLVDAVNYFKEKYNIDPQKVGVHGWSFGGFQTQMCLYTAPDVFTLGIAGAGPTEWLNYNTWYTGGVIAETPAKNAQEWQEKFSLLPLTKNLKAPLLLVHGLEDTNVLFQDTMKVYRELLRNGKGPLVELVVDPTGGHGLGGDIRTLQRFLIYESFIKKHWGPYRSL